MSEDLIVPLIYLVITVSGVASYLLIRNINVQKYRLSKVIFAGFLPVGLLIVALSIWHYVELRAYRASGSNEGFMGPLLFLIYGFPYFVIMLVVDLLAAGWAAKRP